jgi:hypothetical protein
MNGKSWFLVIVIGALLLPGTSGSQVLGPDGSAQGDSSLDAAVVMQDPLAVPQVVQRFAPVLKFHGDYDGLPMSAEAYFRNMLNVPGVSPVIDGDEIYWRAEDDPAPGEGRVLCCGRDLDPDDLCKYGMSNEDFATLSNGEVPTYYRVYYDPDSGSARIEYWWFYGWQGPCNHFCFVKCGKDGAHHGDWEHIEVTTTTDRTAIAAVSYFFHANSYTRQAGYFPRVGERPVVYVGEESHGAYHSQACQGWRDGFPWHCCDFADWREPDAGTVWDTSGNLVDLEGDSESWMAADRIGDLYSYGEQEYTIRSWNWGPSHNYCEWIPLPGVCVQATTQACATHPTVQAGDWDKSSCQEYGCGLDQNPKCNYDCFGYDQGWPWDIWWAYNESWARPQYYRTIQTGDINGDGRSELLARGASGIVAWRYDDAIGWTPLPAGPPWSDASGWDGPQYYRTIQTGDINGDGRAELLARGASGIEAWRYDDATGWTQLPAGPAWSDASGWDGFQYYRTIQTGDINGDGRAELLARGASGIEAWRYDDATGWTQLPAGPPWSDASGWDGPQ